MHLSVNITVVNTELDGRVENFPFRYSSKDMIPVLHNIYSGHLVTKYFHKKFKRNLDMAVTAVRKKFWIQKL